MLVAVLGIDHSSVDAASELDKIQQALANDGHAALFVDNIGAPNIQEQLLDRVDAVVTVDLSPKTHAEIAYNLDLPSYVWPESPPVDPTEANYPQQTRAFRQQLGRLYRQHLLKNSDYSPSNILVTGELGVLVRVADKVMRLLSLKGFEVKIVEPSTLGQPKQENFESLDDSWLDLANYGVIAHLVRRGLWGR